MHGLTITVTSKRHLVFSGFLINLKRFALGAALVIAFSIAGCVTLPGGDAPPGETPQPAAIAEQTELPPTAIPSATPTPVPSITPSITPSPTITLTPTATPIPGWSIIQGNSVSLWLPDSWRGGNLQDDLDRLLADAAGGASALQQYAGVLAENRDAVNLWAYDTQSTSNFHLTNVNIGQEQVDDAVTVDIYIDAINRNLPENFTVTGRELIDINGSSGGRIFIDVLINGLLIKEVMYISKVGNVMWLVTFAATDDTFDTQLQVIEQSVQTLEIGEKRE
jgi:hypothetical protein